MLAPEIQRLRDILWIFAEAQHATPRKRRMHLNPGWFHVDRVLFKRSLADSQRQARASCGRCVICGLRAAASGTWRCQPCKDHRRRAYQAKRARRLEAAGKVVLRGVQRHNGKWQARLYVGQGATRKRVHIGTFATATAAALAHDEAALKHFGPGAKVNFPSRRQS